MKNPVTFSAIPEFACLLFVACNSTAPDITFESALPKAHKDLKAVLGIAFQLCNGHDTLRYHLSPGRRVAVITKAAAGGPVLTGKISRFQDVYFFSQGATDSAWFIYGASIRNHLIYDLTMTLTNR
jgi:hypothetical protein